MNRTIIEVLKTALFHADKAISYTKNDLSEEVTVDACAMRLIATLDAFNSLPDATLAELFGDEWKLMRGMRNRLVHGYFEIDAEVLKNTLENDLPEITAAIRAYLSKQ